MVSILIRKSAEGYSHRASRERIIPYRSFELTPSANPTFTEVVLGPKHETPVPVVKSVLKLAGFGGVEVRPSSASYR